MTLLTRLGSIYGKLIRLAGVGLEGIRPRTRPVQTVCLPVRVRSRRRF
jgi:hypothetical protein